METTSFIALVNLDLDDQADILTFLREFKVPLPSIAVADERTGDLYIASEASLRSVHDPFSGDQVTIDRDIQAFIGHIDRADELFHTVFVDDEGNILVPETSTEIPCTLRPHTQHSAWTAAMLELTFQPENQ